jgi:hypothetical protein
MKEGNSWLVKENEGNPWSIEESLGNYRVVDRLGMWI